MTTPQKLVRGVLSLWSEWAQCGAIDLFEVVDGKSTAYADPKTYDGGSFPKTQGHEVVCVVAYGGIYTWYMADDPYPSLQEVLDAMQENQKGEEKIEEVV